MAQAVRYCPKCQSALQLCNETMFMFGEETERSCGGLFCPQGHGIGGADQRCPLGKGWCFARSIRATLT